MSIIIDPGTLLINLNGFPIRDFPATGTILEIAQGQPTATYEASFGKDAFIFGPEWYTISTTIKAGGESDNIFEASHRAFRVLKAVCSMSASNGPNPIFSSVSLGFTTLPNITFAADGFPMRTWVLTGKCSGQPSAGIYVAAPTLTQEDVQGFLP
jgi:hypothetical protein